MRIKSEQWVGGFIVEPEIHQTTRRRVAGADRIMNESVFVGTYPGLTRAMLDYLIETITRFAKKS